MARRRENMLEAFQASHEQETALQGAEAPPSAAGAPTAPRSPVGPAAPPGEGLTLPLGTVPFLLLQIALLVLVFSIGYLAGQRGDEALAAGGDPGGQIDLITPRGPAASGGGDGAGAPLTRPRPDLERPGASGPEPAATPAEQAFLDPANRFTVVVFTAEDSAFGEQAAWGIHDYLAGAGYPVVRPRRWKTDTKLSVPVGAAPRMAELQALLARIRLDPGPDGAKPFYDAFVDNADRFR